MPPQFAFGIPIHELECVLEVVISAVRITWQQKTVLGLAVGLKAHTLLYPPPLRQIRLTASFSRSDYTVMCPLQLNVHSDNECTPTLDPTCFILTLTYILIESDFPIGVIEVPHKSSHDFTKTDMRVASKRKGSSTYQGPMQVYEPCWRHIHV